MKLLLCSDFHADATTMGQARFSDVDRAVRQTVEYAIEHKVDAYCFLGDLCDPDSGSAVFRSVELAISAAVELSDAGIPNIWIAGNHDVIEDGSGDTTLSPLRPLAGAGSLTKLYERPGKHQLFERLRKDRAQTEELTIHALPFTATSHPYRPSVEIEEKKMLLRSGTHVVLAHLTVPGVEPGEETNEMPRGRDVMFPREQFPDTAQNVHCFQGHYHRQQTHELPGFRPVHIPGSAARFTFGEEQNNPGFLVVEV
jgi:exonuclease SbcD